MSYRLKSRQRAIPNGFRFVQPETGWEAPRWLSFDSLVRTVREHRMGNRAITQKHNLATAYDEIALEVEAYNAALCQKHGWDAFLQEDAGNELPKSVPLSPRRGLAGRLAAAGANLTAGFKTLRSWLGEGGTPVKTETAEARAAICADCPKNVPGDLTSFFTVPASRVITGQLRERLEMGLTTTHDAKLGVCEACSCPLKLKVHTPIEHIRKYVTDDVKSLLDPKCWVPTAQE